MVQLCENAFSEDVAEDGTDWHRADQQSDACPDWQRDTVRLQKRALIVDWCDLAYAEAELETRDWEDGDYIENCEKSFLHLHSCFLKDDHSLIQESCFPLETIFIRVGNVLVLVLSFALIVGFELNLIEYSF